MSLVEIRKQINKVDDQLLELLEKRVGLADKAWGYKDTPEDLQREQAIIERCLAKSKKMSPEFIKKVMQVLFEENKRRFGEKK